jgi:hypothetical protein
MNVSGQLHSGSLYQGKKSLEYKRWVSPQTVCILWRPKILHLEEIKPQLPSPSQSQHPLLVTPQMLTCELLSQTVMHIIMIQTLFYSEIKHCFAHFNFQYNPHSVSVYQTFPNTQFTITSKGLPVGECDCSVVLDFVK